MDTIVVDAVLALVNKAQNAHIVMETWKLRQELSNADFETQQKQAERGLDNFKAAKAAGNNVATEDLHGLDDVAKYQQENKEYLKYTPYLIDVEQIPGAQPDPKTGHVPTMGTYALVDMTKETPITQTQIDHLQKVGLAGADSLKAGTMLSPVQWRGTVWHARRGEISGISGSASRHQIGEFFALGGTSDSRNQFSIGNLIYRFHHGIIRARSRWRSLTWRLIRQE
jgi:hypothetical protein